MSSKAFLIILDGFGEAGDLPGNAVRKAQMPFFNSLKEEYPFTTLEASGQDVGLPPGIMGASEPGHITIGAGRVIFQPLEEINRSIASGDFFKKRKIKEFLERAKESQKNLHLLGMISDGGVHSQLSHLFSLLSLIKKYEIKNVFIHGILDGRDVHEKSGEKYLDEIREQIKNLKIGKIASICGRYYAMDRDKNWDRTKKAYELLLEGKGKKYQGLEKEYPSAKTDYYIEPLKTNDFQAVGEGDSLFFWNFRADRAIQISSALADKKFNKFIRNTEVDIDFLAMGPFTSKERVVFLPKKVKNNLGEVLEKNHKNQVRIAETEKYAHVTFYFNSQDHNVFPHEKRILINSPKCKSYAEKPEMSAREVTEKVSRILRSEKPDFLLLNYANPDLVGHSGSFDAVVKALEFLDTCLKKIVTQAKEEGFDILIISDHGNAEQMLYLGTAEPCASHTTNPVPCILVSDKNKEAVLRDNGGLRDVAPTVLKMMKLEKPSEMAGESLF